MSTKARRANMTEEEKQRQRERDRKRWANRTEEQKQRQRERDRKRWANRTEEQKQRQRERDRKRWANRTEEQKKRSKSPRQRELDKKEEQARRKTTIKRTRDRAKKPTPMFPQGIPFNLTLDYINEIWPKNNKCPILGTAFVRGKGTPLDTSPNFDRIVPSLGYVVGNMQILSALANRIKSNANAAQVLAVGRYVAKQERERE